MVASLPPLQYHEPAPFEPMPPITPAIKHLPVYTPLRHERRLTCSTKHQAYINYYAPVAQHPTHCPHCSSVCTSSEYDSADVIVTTHQHFTRKAATTCLNHLRQINLARPNTKPYTIEEYLKMAGVNTPSYSTNVNSETRAACYLHSSCHSCGGTFTILYTTIPVQHTPPKHCVWCGSDNIYTVQADTEETCFITLSLHYNLPLALLKALYNIWHTSSHYQYFSQYMQSEPVTQITSKVQLS